jgi:hypothetical protein
MPTYRTDDDDPDLDIVALSGQLLYAVKTESPTDSFEAALAEISKPKLIASLSNDRARNTFWINIYNAYYQILATREKKTRPEIFTDKAFVVGSLPLSLDDVEHGILRKYRWKLSMGYLPQFWPNRNIKKLAVTKIDYRIHFALNCGAKSCPPIAFYDYDNLEQQLEMATSSFLTQDVEVDEASKTVRVTKLMQWFKSDFGSSRGIKAILQKHLNKDFTHYKIAHKDYDWSADLRNFE